MCVLAVWSSTAWGTDLSILDNTSFSLCDNHAQAQPDVPLYLSGFHGHAAMPHSSGAPHTLLSWQRPPRLWISCSLHSCIPSDVSGEHLGGAGGSAQAQTSSAGHVQEVWHVPEVMGNREPARGWMAHFRAGGCHSAVIYCSSSAVTLCWQKSALTLIWENCSRNIKKSPKLGWSFSFNGWFWSTSLI